MNASIKIFTWFKVPVYLHWSFSLILIFLGWQSNQHGLSVSDIFFQFFALIALFACVLLHEFGHSLMARHYGVKTQDIILTPIGGIARLEKMPELPKQELLVAIAGPMVNVAIILLLFIVSKFILFSGEIEWWYFKQSVMDMLSFRSGTDEAELVLQDSGINMPTWMFLLPLMMVINITMVLFNMIPAFPMDGGRVFRSLLAMSIGRVKATRIASYLGQFLAAGFVVYGLYSQQYMLAFIGFFVFNTARQEESMVSTDDVLSKFQAKDLMRTQFTRLTGNDWMQTPIELYTRTAEKHFLVFNFSEELLGYLDEQSILQATKTRALTTQVTEFIKSPVQIVNENESLKYVHHLLQQSKQGILAVVDDAQKLLGVIDFEGFEKFMKINQR